ncbi:hypothetical protein [Vannielia litorea]|uniref:Glycosyl transferase family 2 n=1 Tax=Vannielia litorea TaxID=1217970 RepID=A0A1N6EJE6_9RHOB|nr:hypothetical protein [Vannielia litorea]SIN83169.1 hypothetical protein SAMN05444002_0853 [Vannielia litorea]
MAQAPATPKWKRAALRAAAALSPALARALGPAPSEQAALARRAQPLAAPTAPEVVFLIPLVGRHHVGDWATVEARLSETLASLAAQTDSRWRALVCGQDAPALPDDPRIIFLPFTEAVEGNDKWRKLAALCRALPDHGPEDGYVMPFDADDLLARGAVAEMLTRRMPGGYLVQDGWLMNVGTGTFARAARRSLAQPGQKPFWKLCGSCAAFRCTRDPGDAAFLEALTAHEHRMFPYLAALAGRPLAPLHAPAALYILNHGENFGARRGRVSFKARFVERFAVGSEEEARIRSAFPTLPG